MANEIKYVLVGKDGEVVKLPSRGPFFIGRNAKGSCPNDLDLFPFTFT